MLKHQFDTLTEKHDSIEPKDPWMGELLESYVSLSAREYIVKLFSYTLGFQWLLNIANARSKREYKTSWPRFYFTGIFKRVEADREAEREQKERANIPTPRIANKVTAYSFWALPFNWIVINLAELITLILFIPIGIIGMALAGFESLGRYIVSAIQKALVKNQIKNLVKNKNPAVLNLAQHYMSQRNQGNQVRMMAGYLPLSAILQKNNRSAARLYMRDGLEDYLFYRSDFLKKEIKAKKRIAIVTGIFIIPLLFTISNYRKTKRNNNHEMREINTLQANIRDNSHGSGDDVFHSRMLYVMTRQDCTSDYALIRACEKSYGSVYIANCLEWARIHGKKSELLSLANLLKQKNSMLLDQLMEQLGNNPVFCTAFDRRVVKMSAEVVNKLGSNQYSLIINALKNKPQLMLHLYDILKYAINFTAEYFDQYLSVITQGAEWDSLQSIIENALARIHFGAQPELPLEDVLARFANKGPDVDFPLSAYEVAQMREQYAYIKAYGDTLINMSGEELSALATETAAAMRASILDEQPALKLFAIIRQQIKETFGVFPYNIQMLNVLAQYNRGTGCIAQVKTGEGKSIINAMLAAFYALKKLTVDVNTTTADLAVRDAKKFAPFYQGLGITSGHICKHSPSGADFKPTILYGTTADFEFSILWDLLGIRSRGGRLFCVVIVDEVDSMFIDMKNMFAYVAAEMKDKKLFNPEVYKAIWNYAGTVETLTLELLTAHLKTVFPEVEYPKSLLERWVTGVLIAQNREEGRDYIVKNKNIHIVDFDNTGTVMGTNQWTRGTHSFLQVKHNLPISIENQTACGISHREYFKKYIYLFGLTGTAGGVSDRNQLTRLYGVKTYDSPTYRPSKRRQVPSSIKQTPAEKLQAILAQAKDIVAQGRPQLFLCETIKYSEEVCALLKEAGLRVQLYNGKQSEEAVESMIEKAGFPDMITVATNTAGRGTDITPTEVSETNGGLHVTWLFLPKNKRVRQQGDGRTGRQGRGGTLNSILCEDDFNNPNYFNLEEKLTDDEIIALYDEYQERKNDKKSEQELKTIELNHLEYLFQCLFFAIPFYRRSDELKDKWAIFYTAMQERVLTLSCRIDDEEDDLDIYHAEYVCWYRFLQFWHQNNLTALFDPETPIQLTTDAGGLPFTQAIYRGLKRYSVAYLDSFKDDGVSESLFLSLKHFGIFENSTSTARGLSSRLFHNVKQDINPKIIEIITCCLYRDYDYFAKVVDEMQAAGFDNDHLEAVRNTLDHSEYKFTWKDTFFSYVEKYKDDLQAQRLETSRIMPN